LQLVEQWLSRSLLPCDSVSYFRALTG